MTPDVPASVQVETALRSLVEFLPYGILLRVDGGLCVEAAAGHGLAYLTASPTELQELIGQPLHEVLAPAVLAPIAASLRTALEGTAGSIDVAAPGGGRLQLATQPLPIDDGRGQHAALLFGAWDADVGERDKERLAVAIRAANVGLWDLDVRTDRVHYSAEWKRQIGYEDDEIADTAEEWASRLHPDDMDAALRNVQEFIATHGSSYQHEFRLRHKNGSYRHILSQSTMQFDAEGQAVHLYGSHVDITERVQAEAALRASEAALYRSEEKFARFFHSSPIPLNVSRIYDGRFIEVNTAFVEQFGYSRAEALGCTPVELGIFTQDTIEKLRGIMVGDGRVQDIEVAVTCKSGAVKQVLTSGVILELPEGTHVLISNVDITALKHNAQLLRDSAQALEQSQVVAHVGHWIWNPQTGEVTWSDEMKRIFGLDPEGFGGDLHKLIAATVHPDDAQRVEDGVRMAVAEQRMVEEEYRVVLPDGSVRHVWAVAGEPLCDERGNAVQVSGVVQDITERKHAEQMQMLLERQERLAAVGQLAAGIAHDFNNIMSIISIYAELTSLAPGLTDKERARTQTIIDQAQRAARMIRQILDFARQSVFERHALDLLPLLKEQVKLFRQTLPENIEITLAADPGEYFVMADPTRMQQMVMNLVVNARDAMPGGGRLDLELRRWTNAPDFAAPAPVVSGGDWLRLAVTDTGIGMPPEVLEHLYEPFFTTKAPGKGTGLGVPQVHGIVAQHEGHMTVTSVVGEGTTFYIFLPVHQPEGAGVTLVATPANVPHGRGERILVAEDDAALRISLVDLLESWHYEVLAAGDGEEALALLAQCSEPIDLILSDVVMPRLGGIALVETLRQRRNGTPVILMSGHPIGEDRSRLERVGIAAWLDKPPSQQQLAQTIAAACGGGSRNGLAPMDVNPMDLT